MAKEDFKNFVRKNPKLINYVKEGKSSWQKFYEIFDLYGEDEKVWKEYLTEKEETLLSALPFAEIVKNVDLDSIQNGVNSMQRILSLFQDIGKNKEKTKEYKPRPLYKHFED